MDAATNEPLEFYTTLTDAPVQLSMPGVMGRSGSAPPMMTVTLPPAAAAGVVEPQPDSSAAAGDGAAAQQQQQQPASSNAGGAVTQLLAGGNCLFELGDGGSQLVVKVEGKPVGACQHNPCRALDLLLGLPPGQTTISSG